ncbi:leucine-rich repeat protein [Niallia sp. Sow4_A1]|uniref:leucine-rich repeat protein n=1 Tax=Niallia sp. Sow4_A1 TaxID=3438793 RepID=UPI003F963294
MGRSLLQKKREGYTSLYDEKGDHATLSLPFLGYYGNWTDPSIFDNTVYDKIQPTTQTSTIMINSNAAGSGYYLGRNAITGKYDKEKIAFSPSLNGDNSRIFTSITSLLRNAENLSFKIKDANDKDVWSYVYGDARKTFFSSTQGAYIPILNMQGWNGKDEKGQQVPSGTELIYEVSGKIAGTDTEKTLDLPFTVDTEAPTVENVDIVKEDSKVYLTFDVKDDNYIQQILVGDVAGHVLLFELGIDYVEKKGETSTVRADITNLGEELANQSLNPGRLSIFGFDYAYNISTNYVDIGPQAIVLDKYLDLTIGESKKVNATVKPENLADKSLTWTSSDDKIATVDADGVVTGIAKGEVTITATAVTGLTSSIKVYVDTDVPGEGETEDPDEENPEQPDEDDAIGYSDMSIDADHSIISKDLNDTFQYENFYYKVTSNDEVQLIGEPDKLFSSYDTIKGNVYIPSEVENNGKKYKVTSIGAKAFYFNNSITSIEFSEGLKVIGESAFFYASALSNVKMPDSVERIDDNAFNGASITKINIPKNIKSIGSFAFLFIDAFEELTLPEGLESIGEQSFGFVSSMKKLILPDTLKYIGEAAFTDSASLETVKLPEKMKAVPKFMFFKASSLKEIEFPTSVTSIGYGSFQSSGLTTIDIPETVTKVEKFAFADISSLEKIVIPNSVKEIGTYAFAQSTKANEVKIGKNVKTIGKDAFTGISREAAVNVANDQVAFELRRSGFTNPLKSGGVSFTDYVSGQFMVGSLIYRPTSATTVEVTQFENNKKLQELVIPETVTNEGDNITYTVTSVYDYVFQGNQDLKKITLPDTITKIGERAFDQINGLDTMNIPENLQLVEEYGLNYLGWDPLLASEWTEKELTIPDGLTHLKAVSFSGNKYESINIANGTKKIPAYTFYGNKKAEKLEIPNSVEMIESSAFADLESLKELNLPDNLKYIGGNAFSGLNSMDKVAIPNSVEYIGDYAFNSMVGSSIKDVSLGNGVNAYGWNSFNEEANVTVSLNSQREDIVKFNNLKQTPELIWDGEVDIPTTDASVIPEGKKVSVIGDRTIDGNLTINGTLEIAKDASLTINGTLKINGKITGKGTLIISEEAQIGDIDPEVFIPVTSIKITKSIAITEDKGTAQIEAEVYPTFATNKNLNYDLISGDEFASVNEKGVITAKGNGQIVVRVSAADQFGTYVDLNVTISGQSEVIDDEQDPENPDDGTEDEQDSENPGKGIDNDNTNTVNQENNKNSQNVSNIGNGSGKESNGTHQLPETGTHSYNYLLIGFILIFASILFLYIARRKKQVNQAK